VGTHIDSPGHFIEEGITIDEVPLERLMGNGVLIDVSFKKTGSVITPSDLKATEVEAKKKDIVVLNTGSHKIRKQGGSMLRYSYLSSKAANWLVNKGISMFATDADSVDSSNSKDFPVHHILLGKGIPIVEGLANLDQIRQKHFFFIALPLKIKSGDASPCRALIIEESP